MGNLSAMCERKPRPGIAGGVQGRECQSPTRQKTRAWPKAGGAGGRCSLFSAARGSSWAPGLGGRIAATKARWRRSNRRSWPVDTRSPAETWTSSCLGRRTQRGESFTSWDPASWHGGISRLPAQLGRASCRVPSFRRKRLRGGCMSCKNPGCWQPQSSLSTTPPTTPAMIGRPCKYCSCLHTAT